MAKVINRKSPHFHRIITCEKCESKTQYNKNDLERDRFKISGYHFDGTAVCESRYFLTCPVCKKYEFIPDNNISEVVKIFVRENGKDFSNKYILGRETG